MSHGPPSLGGDFFGFSGQSGSHAGAGVLSNDKAAAAAASLAQQPQQQQQQANDEALMMFFNEPSPSFFDSFNNMQTAGLGAQQPGAMFAPPHPQYPPHAQHPQQAAAAPGMASAFAGLQQQQQQLDGAQPDDSPSRDTSDGVESSIVMGGMGEPGGGPQPLDGFGGVRAGSSSAPVAGGGASGALTEFTRRKNWPAKVIEELTDLLLIIEPNGRIRFASPNTTRILGYTPEVVAGQSLTELAHPDDRSVLLSDLNACIANASVLRLYVRLRKQDGSYAIVEMVGHAHIAASRFAPNPSNKSPFCQAVFLMARPYPTKNANLLDSFLEHKMENERLRRRIEDLRREEEDEDRDEESNAQSWVWRQSMDARSDMAATNNGNPGAAAMPPPMAPLSLGNSMSSNNPNNVALTRENLEGIAARRADSLCDKMARYEGMPGAAPASSTVATPGSGIAPTPGSAMSRLSGPAGNLAGTAPNSVPTVPTANAGAASALPLTGSTADTIEMLTGLRYTEGERSRGLSTGNRSPRLIKGDAGIAFSVNRDQRASGDKKKKARLAEEYVCTDCGTLESPEWRKGPSGPKTLCNACGLRWAKKEKREKKRAAAAAAAGGVGGVGSVVPGSVGMGGGSPLHDE